MRFHFKEKQQQLTRRNAGQQHARMTRSIHLHRHVDDQSRSRILL